jgi:CheY-like chemotaxis protein
MPVMDGLVCTQKIKNHEEPSIRTIPIIAITGNTKNYSTSQYIDKGINEVLYKPLNYDHMVLMINKYI